MKISRDHDTMGHIGSILKSAIAINLRRTNHHLLTYLRKNNFTRKKSRIASDV